MKFFKAFYIVFLTGVLLTSLACNKSQSTALPSTRFTWTYNGTTHFASQFSAFLYSRGTFLIIGAQGNTLESFPQSNFSLNSFNKGTYSINSTRLNVLRYVDDAGDDFEASTGEVNITAYGSDVISGNFSAMLLTSTGATRPISGSFTNIPVVP